MGTVLGFAGKRRCLALSEEVTLQLGVEGRIRVFLMGQRKGE